MNGDQRIHAVVNGDTKQMVQYAEELGLQLKRENLSTSQIRNVFESVKKMEMKKFDPNELMLLKPKLAYSAARPGAKRGARTLREILSKAIDYVGDDEEKFGNFCDFFEAILAYHRAAEKRVIG